MSYQILSHCERITDTGINHLIDGPCGETLQVLELDNCPLVTDDTLERLRYITNLLLDSKMSLSSVSSDLVDLLIVLKYSIVNKFQDWVYKDFR